VHARRLCLFPFGRMLEPRLLDRCPLLGWLTPAHRLLSPAHSTGPLRHMVRHCLHAIKSHSVLPACEDDSMSTMETTSSVVVPPLLPSMDAYPMVTLRRNSVHHPKTYTPARASNSAPPARKNDSTSPMATTPSIVMPPLLPLTAAHLIEI
jgi:hypothetical protein